MSDFKFIKDGEGYIVGHYGDKIGRIHRWGRCGWSLFIDLKWTPLKNMNGTMEQAAEQLLQEYKSCTGLNYHDRMPS